jgi:hypothetical protein
MTEFGNHEVRRVTVAGAVSTVAGNGPAVDGPVGGGVAGSSSRGEGPCDCEAAGGLWQAGGGARAGRRGAASGGGALPRAPTSALVARIEYFRGLLLSGMQEGGGQQEIKMGEVSARAFRVELRHPRQRCRRGGRRRAQETMRAGAERERARER